jgi:hypothetical protein
MTELSDKMHHVNEILEKYMTIHDKLFKFSLRKVIPIPGIFKPANYDQNIKELDSLIFALERVSISKNNSPEIINIYQQYITALRKTIRFLRNICWKLDDKSHGDLEGYTIDKYKSDVDTYKGLMDRYQLLEKTLNEYISNGDAGQVN